MKTWRLGHFEMDSYKEEVTEEAEGKIREWLEAIGEDARSTAAQDGICPRKTGNLQGSISKHVYSDRLAVDIGTNVEYAAVQEFGTRDGKIRGKHYIQYGATAHIDTYSQMLKDKLSE